ncbi:MAG: M13 family metallopeptidase N-terminal domain-containing protein, partial [Nitrospirota bacterium]|nr:M13 family metallopeptidase N-terminal domain-containing protein [Nitrospirota bacterium]
MAKKYWGFDVGELDAAIRPQDDFFHHANKKWMDANPIPKTESRWGSFTILRLETEKQLRALVEEVSKKESLPEKSAERMVRDFYRSGMDRERRNALDLSPLSSLLRAIDAISDKKSLERTIALLHTQGVGALWGIDVDQDMKASEKYALYLGQDGLSLPDRDYYLKDDAESVRVRDAYKVHVTKIFGLIGSNTEGAKAECDTVLRIETRLAKASMKKEDMRDPEKTYHKYTMTSLRKVAPGIDWEAYLTRMKGSKASYYLVMQPDFFKEVNQMLSEVS